MATITPNVDEALSRFAFRMSIGDDLSDAAGGATRPVEDPSTGEQIHDIPEGGSADVERAVQAGSAAQPAWEGLGVPGRSEHILRLADAIEAQAETLALIDAIDSGNPLDAMRFDLWYAVFSLRQWPSMVRWRGGTTIPATPNGLHYTTSSPYGVTARIVPFNHPALFGISRTVAALLAGNAVVLKPSEQTSLSALAFGEIAAEILPAGILSVVTGGAEVGDAIVSHPEIKRIAFTGSVATGMRIQRRAAEVAVKNVTLELGGKNAMVILPDIDVERAVDTAIEGMNLTVCQGQSCGSNSRTFVHDAIYDDFVEALVGRVSQLTVGPAYAKGTEMGPLVSGPHAERVKAYIAGARDEGARLVTGGERPSADLPAGGHYLAPAVFADVGPGMRIAREEIFGPVMSTFRWSDLDDVVTQANASDLGLTAAVHTHDIDLAHALARRLEAGYVWINDSAKHYPGTPFGGMKNSGTGREESVEEYDSFREPKVIHTMLADERAAMARLAGGS